MKKKIIRIVLWSVGSVILLLLIGVFFFGGSLIKAVVNGAGPSLLGVPVALKDATFKPFSGKIELKGLHVGNPEGFKTSGIFDLGTLFIDLDSASLFKKVIIIREIRIENPEITYERALKNSNIGTLMDQLAAKEAAAEEKPKADGKPKAKSEKKVVIQKLSISGSRVNTSITALGGRALVLPLPPISLSNIGGDGKEAKGVTFLEAIRDIIGAVFKRVTDVVTGAGKLAVDGAKAVGGAAVDGVSAVGGVAVDGVKAVGAGAGKAVGGVKNLLGFGSKDEKPKVDDKPAEPKK
jgi:hypothetical protein